MNLIHPTLDGEVTSHFEWLGAGRYRPDPRSGAMHGGSDGAQEMFYGWDDANLYIRLDGADGDSFAMEFESGAVAADVARGRIVEMKAAKAGKMFRVVVKKDGLVVRRALLKALGMDRHGLVSGLGEGKEKNVGRSRRCKLKLAPPNCDRMELPRLEGDQEVTIQKSNMFDATRGA